MFHFEFHEENTEKQKAKVREVTQKKKAAQYEPTWAEVWYDGYASHTGALKKGIFQHSNSEKDTERLKEVKKAIDEGNLTKGVDSHKKFTKAHALRLYAFLEEAKREDILKEMVKNKPKNYVLVEDDQTLTQLIKELKKGEIYAFDVETFGTEDKEHALDPWKGKIAGFSVSNSSWNFYLPLNHTEKTTLNEKYSDTELIALLKPHLESLKTVMHNAPFDCKFMWLQYGVDMITNLVLDTRIGAFMLDENRLGSTHRLKDLVSDWLKIPSNHFDELFKVPFNEVPLGYTVYAIKDTEVTLKLYNYIAKHMQNGREDMRKIYALTFDIEMAVCRIFIRADLKGIGFNKEEAGKLDKQYEVELQVLEKEIYTLLGREINLSSPSQLKEVLYTDLKLPDLDKGSTGVKTLKKIKDKHPAISLILEYRGLDKLRSAFTQSLPTKVQNDGRIHPSHNSLGAKTGRFTCSNPNTQQIPSKRPEIRRLFTPAEGKIFISYDLSQIELRTVAELAGETVMINAFNAGQDMHSTTAAAASGIPYAQIEANKDVEGSKEQKWRKIAKTLNFGVLYGISAKGLAEMLECSEKEAQDYIDNFFSGYPKITAFMEAQKELVKKQKYVTDMYGRKRRFHSELQSGDKYKLFGVFRQVCNYPVQATAGSFLKEQIIKVNDLLPTLQAEAQILLQIHDEIVLEVDEDISYEEVLKIKQTIETTTRFGVPIKSDAEISVGRWMDIVPIEDFFKKGV